MSSAVILKIQAGLRRPDDRIPDYASGQTYHVLHILAKRTKKEKFLVVDTGE